MDCCFNFDGKYIGTNSYILFWSCQNLLLMLRVKIDCCFNFDGKYIYINSYLFWSDMSEFTILNTVKHVLCDLQGKSEIWSHKAGGR